MPISESPDGFGTEAAMLTISSALSSGTPMSKPALIAPKNRFAIRHCPMVPGWNPSARNRCCASLLALMQSISRSPTTTAGLR